MHPLYTVSSEYLPVQKCACGSSGMIIDQVTFKIYIYFIILIRSSHAFLLPFFFYLKFVEAKRNGLNFFSLFYGFSQLWSLQELSFYRLALAIVFLWIIK